MQVSDFAGQCRCGICLMVEHEIDEAECSEAAADDSGDGEVFAGAFGAGFGDLVESDDAEDDGEPADGGAGGEADDSENEAGDAEAVGTTGGVEGGSFHGEGHAAGFAVVGGDGAGGGA